MNTQKQDWFKKHWIISIFLGLLALGTISSIINPDKSIRTNTNTQTSSEKKEEISIEKQYIEVFKFSGTGQKKSEPFKITGSRMKIAYDCKGDPKMTYCGAFLYEVGSKLPQGIMNAAQPIKDETIVYGSGEYYIDTNTTGSFSMVVYDYK